MRHLARTTAWLRAENLALPLAALLVALAELISLRAIWVASFGPVRRIPEAADIPLGHAVMWGLGVAAAVLSITGAYRLVRHGRAWVAALVVPLCCFPAMLAGLGSLYASLVVGAVL
ncbi:MAG TPA: hypothetical protein VFU21_29335 [Kofleriaceae bacterium]|nr:hypothetical protein [Kofleriaceae bacterium]